MAGVVAASAGASLLKFVFSGPGLLTIAGLGAAAVIGVQTLRLDNAKAGEAKAQAALIDPASKKTWQVEEMADRAALATCQANEITLNGAISTQNASLNAAASASAAALARSEAIVKQAAAGQAATAAAVAALQKPIAGADAASRCANQDSAFLATLK